MMRKCHQNTCPVGVATQDPELRKRFTGKPEHLINYFSFMVTEVREIMAELGIRKFDDLVGTDATSSRCGPSTTGRRGPWTRRALLYVPGSGEANRRRTACRTRCTRSMTCWTARSSSRSSPALDALRPHAGHDRPAHQQHRPGRRAPCSPTRYPAASARRACRTIPSSCTFRGSAGQSFGAFLAQGHHLPARGRRQRLFRQGAFRGQAHRGAARGEHLRAGGEHHHRQHGAVRRHVGRGLYPRHRRRALRRAQQRRASPWSKGTGDHCAEYMTGGRIIVLGKVGRNFAAGMSGGIAYVLDRDGDLRILLQQGHGEPLAGARIRGPGLHHRAVSKKHVKYTGSTVAQDILHSWYEFLPNFVKVLPLRIQARDGRA